MINKNNEEAFDKEIMLIENNPEFVLSRLDTCTPSKITTEKEATDFLLQSLARNYTRGNYYPEKEKLQASIQIFSKNKSVSPQLEALYLLAEMYKREQDLDNEVATIKSAIDIAKQKNDDVWLFHLYSYLSEMYIREHDMLKYIKYQTLANQSIKDVRIPEADVYTKMLIGKSYLYTEQYAKACQLLESIEPSMNEQNIYYSEYKRLRGIAYFKQEQWQFCIEEMKKSLEQEGLPEHKFTCYSILTYCYYHLGDMPRTLLYKDLAMQCDAEGETGYTEIEFYKVCADIARENQNSPGEIACLKNVVNKYDQVVRELSGHTLDGAIRAYTRLHEKRIHARQIGIYQFAIFGLLLALAGWVIVYISKKRKQAYRYLSLQQQIEALEELKSIKDETKSLILRDFEIAKQIALLKHTQRERSAKFLKELERFDLLKDNNLLTTQWDKFYHHIDISFNRFYSNLVKEYPALNEKEIQLCCMLMAEFKTEEIAAIWLQSVFSVHKYKTSIRKKLQAPEGADIITFLRGKRPLQ